MIVRKAEFSTSDVFQKRINSGDGYCSFQVVRSIWTAGSEQRLVHARLYLSNAGSSTGLPYRRQRPIFVCSMRDRSSITVGWIMLFIVFAMSSCASGAGGFAAKIQQPPGHNGVTIGPATVEPGTSEFERPWPFGPLGMDED